MKDPHTESGRWRYMIEAEQEPRFVASHLPLIFSAAGAIGVLPFMVLRYMQGEWTAAFIDTAIVTALFSLGAYVYKTRRVEAASIAIACICVLGIISTVWLIGPYQIYWAYPALMAIFYLVRPRLAILLVIITIAALAPRLSGNFDAHTTTTIVITMIVMCAFAFGFSLISNRQRKLLVRMATRDPLTGAGNRRHLDSKLKEVVNVHRRTGVTASIVILDLDHFKKVNDVYGHPAGDAVLVAVSRSVTSALRAEDIFARYGGEEFAVILRGIDLANAYHVGERIRVSTEAQRIGHQGQVIRVTISVGCASLACCEAPSAEALIATADRRLYAAKRGGRNRVVWEG